MRIYGGRSLCHKYSQKSTMLVLFLAAVVLVALVYHYGIKPMQYWKDRGVPQGNPIWFFGDNLGLLMGKEHAGDMFRRLYNAFPERRYVGVYQFSLPTVLVRDPELIKQLFIKDFDHFTDHRQFIPEKADPFWCRNIFASKGRDWRDMRSILSPSFTSSKLKNMFELISKCSENFVDHFLERDQDLEVAEMKDLMTRFTNDVIATTAFGVEVDSFNNPKNEFYMMAKGAKILADTRSTLKFLGFIMMPKVFQLLNISLLPKNVVEFFKGLVEESMRIREEKHIVRPDILHLLMEAKKGIKHKEETEVIDTGFARIEESEYGKSSTRKVITNTEIIANALMFFFAAFESVSSLLCFMSYELAVNSDIQERLRKEIKKTLNECKGKITYEALLKMKYMDMVVSETMRKWPITVGTDRVCTKPYTIPPTKPNEQPVHFEKGDVLIIPIIGIHRDPKYYPDPDCFDPERFNDENKGNITANTYIPFGVGPRGCIATRFALLETKIIFFRLLSHFEFVPIEKTTIPLQIEKKGLVMVAEGGIWLGLKRLRG
ncbi:hypothetical protein JTB14_026052 [Gonioctena quinquepunctata]|nr:hypothetical protein JTB14_026052 [Gonioctena quinquepunctata]